MHMCIISQQVPCHVHVVAMIIVNMWLLTVLSYQSRSSSWSESDIHCNLWVLLSKVHHMVIDVLPIGYKNEQDQNRISTRDRCMSVTIP